MRRTLTILVPLTLGLAPRAQDGVELLVERAAAKLAAVGYAVPEGVEIEKRDAAGVASDLDAQQDMFVRASTFTGQYWLLINGPPSAGIPLPCSLPRASIARFPTRQESTMAESKSKSGVYAVLVIGFALVTVGLGLEGPAGIAVTGSAIVLFVAALVMSLGGGSSGDQPPSP